MAEFKKFEVDSETFDAIYKKVYEEFVKAKNETFNEDIKEALENVVFDVKDPFDIEKWNSCTVMLPEDLEGVDLIIREKGLGPVSGVNATNVLGTLYFIGWYSDFSFSISGAYEDSVQERIEKKIEKNPENWEYRVIPFN